MHAYQMMPEPDAAPESHLDALIAALMLADPSAHLLDRGPHGAQLKVAQGVALLFESPNAAQLQSEVRAAVQAVKPGQVAFLVAIDFPGLGAREVLEREVPSALTQVRSRKQAYTWAPGCPPVAVRGAMFSTLAAAVKRLEAGQVADPAAVIAARASQSDEVQQFMAPLLKRRPWVTWSVAALSVALFALQMLWGSGEPYVAAPRMGASVGSLIDAGQLWRLLAPMLLHGSIAHLLFNMVALLGFGTFLERVLGWRRYVLLYVVSGLGGGIASALHIQDVLSVGASGGIWGLMVAGAVLVTWPRGRLPALVSAAQRGRAWLPVGINALYSFQPGVDLLAHLGGGLTGGLLMFSGLLMFGIPTAAESNDPLRPPRREPWVVSASAGLFTLLLLASVAVALVTGRPWELQSAPAMTRVSLEGDSASVPLPTLITPRGPNADSAHTHVFGSLQYDPLAFVLVLPAVRVTDEETAAPEATLLDVLHSLKPDALEGFTIGTPTELRHQGGRPYLYSRQSAKDGRSAEVYWVMQGHRLANVMVLFSKGTSQAWRAAGQGVPFALQLD